MGKSYADKSNIININIEDNLENIISSLSEKLENNSKDILISTIILKLMEKETVRSCD